MRFYIAALMLLFIFVLGSYFYGRSYWYPYYLKIKGKRTLSDVIEKYGHDAEKRFLGDFEKANMPYPPRKLILFALKEQKNLEVWASNNENE